MTNENELKVDGLLCELSLGSGFLSYDAKVREAVSLIKSQQSRIELCESAIREFNAADKATDHAEDGCALGDINIDYFERKWKAEETLRKLMEDEK